MSHITNEVDVCIPFDIRLCNAKTYPLYIFIMLDPSSCYAFWHVSNSFFIERCQNDVTFYLFVCHILYILTDKRCDKCYTQNLLKEYH